MPGFKDYANYPVGVAAPDGTASQSILTRTDGVTQLVTDNFNQITLENEMKPDKMAPTARGVYSFGGADAFVNWATTNGMTVHGHSLLFAAVHSAPQIPQWMKDFQGNRTQWEEMTDEFIQDVASHFAGTAVISWDVVNEAFNDTGRTATPWQINIDGNGGDHITDAFVSARAADPTADLYMTDYGIIHNGPKFGHFMTKVNSMLAASTPITGIGFQFHEITQFPPDSTIRAAFQTAVNTGLKVKVCELDIRVNYQDPNTTLTPAKEAAQGQKYAEIFQAYIDVVPPAQRGGFSVWGVLDTESWMHNNGNEWPLLWNGNLTPKDAYNDLLAAFQANPAAPTVDFEILAPANNATGLMSPLVISGATPDAGLHQVRVFNNDASTVVSDWGDVAVSVNAGANTWSAAGIAIPQSGESITIQARRLV